MMKHEILKGLLVALLILVVQHVKAQSFEQGLYKDRWCERPAKAKKAKYKRYSEQDGNLKRNYVTKMDEGCIVYREVWEGERPVGHWIKRGEECSGGLEMRYAEEPGDSLFYASVKEIDMSVYERPSFPGGIKALNSYVMKHLRFPASARMAGLSGTTEVEFIVSEEGQVIPHAIIKSAHPILDFEAWRVIKSMPDWTPVKENEEAIAAFTYYPIEWRVID